MRPAVPRGGRTEVHQTEDPVPEPDAPGERFRDLFLRRGTGRALDAGPVFGWSVDLEKMSEAIDAARDASATVGS